LNNYGVLSPKTYEKVEDIERYPVVIKPTTEGSSVGLYICNNKEEVLNTKIDNLLGESVVKEEVGEVVAKVENSDVLNPINSSNHLNIINGLGIKKLVNEDYLLTFTICRIPNSAIIYDKNRCDLFLNPDIELSEYINLLRSNPYLEINDSLGPVTISNISGILMSNKKIEYNYSNQRVYSIKSEYTDYIVDEALVTYQIKSKILNQLYSHGFESLKTNDEDELVEVPDIISYSIQNSDYELSPKRGSYFLNKLYKVMMPIEWKISATSISKIWDIKNKYINLELISNITSIKIKDYNGNDFRIALEWDLQPSGIIGDKDSIKNEQGNYSHNLSVSCKVHFIILMEDRMENAKITRINLLLRFGLNENNLSITYQQYNQI
jgi:hypothetical protein